MNVGYVSEASDTEQTKRTPPLPDPARALNVSIQMSDTVEIVNRIIVPMSPAMMLFTDNFHN